MRGISEPYGDGKLSHNMWDHSTQALNSNHYSSTKCILLTVEGETHIEMPACQIFQHGYEGWVNSSLINTSYLEKTNQMLKPIDCMWIINVTVGWKVSERLISIHYIYPSVFPSLFILQQEERCVIFS
jgi:hypothetical protein